MIRIISNTLFCLLFLSVSYAQLPMMGSGGGGNSASAITGKITGTIIDSTSGNPVEFATISLEKAADGKVVNGVISDEKGNFKLENVKTGKYKISISFMGYATEVIDDIELTLVKPDHKIGRIKLAADAKALKEVEVQGEAALIENRPDKIIYNAEKDVTSANGNAGDLLRKVPMVTVDQDGNVQLRGSSNVKVLINGKPSGMMAGSVADALRLIPADQIKNVEVITNPSAKYDAEGTAGIINIITKKKDIQGLNGSVNGSVGTRQNFSHGSLNLRKGRFGINSTFGGNWSWKQQATTSYHREDLANDKKRTLNQNGTNESKRGGGRGQIGFDYDVNNYHNISSTLNLNGWGQHLNGLTNSTYAGDTGTTTYSRTSDQNISFLNYDWTTDYRHTFKRDKDQELGVSLQLTQGFNDNTTDYSLTLPMGTENSTNNSINREMTSQVDYTHPVNKKMTIEAGLKNIMRDISSEYVYTVNGTLDKKRSNEFAYNQDVYSGYTTVSYNFPKEFSLKAGARVEHTEIGFNFTSDVKDTSNDYTNLIPTLSFSKSFKQGKTFKLSYSRRIQRPSLFYLNPYENTGDPKNTIVGNPKLAPEIAHSYELGYSSFWKGVFLNTAVFYRHTTDLIESVLSIDQGGKSTTTYQNSSTSNTYGFNAFGSVTVLKKLTLRGNINVYYDLIQSNANSNLTNEGLSYNGNMMASYPFPKDWNFELFGFARPRQRTLQGVNPGFSMVNFGVRKEFLKKKASLGLTVTNPFKENKEFISELGDKNLVKHNFYQYSNYSVPFRSIGISFRYQFGKLDFSQQQRKKKGINNDDLKQGGDSQGGN